MKTTLVCGGAGFIGSHLCERLLDEGHRVIAVDNFITGRKRNLAPILEHDRFTLLEVDVTERFSCDDPIDYLFHLASPASPPDFKRIPIETMKAGSYATHVLLELAREKGARFLFSSTSEVYGDPPNEHHPQRETYWGNVNPIGERAVYDEAKRYAEALTAAYYREFALETRIARIFNTYGPRMSPDDGRVVTNFVGQALRGEPLTLYGDGSQTRSFCYVTDTVDGLYRLMMSAETTPVNIGNPIELTVRELAETIVQLTGSKSDIATKPLLFQDDPKQRRPDIAKAEEVLGWRPVVTIEEGLPNTIAHLREELGIPA